MVLTGYNALRHLHGRESGRAVGKHHKNPFRPVEVPSNCDCLRFAQSPPFGHFVFDDASNAIWRVTSQSGS